MQRSSQDLNATADADADAAALLGNRRAGRGAAADTDRISQPKTQIEEVEEHFVRTRIVKFRIINKIVHLFRLSAVSSASSFYLCFN